MLMMLCFQHQMHQNNKKPTQRTPKRYFGSLPFASLASMSSQQKSGQLDSARALQRLLTQQEAKADRRSVQPRG